MAILRRDTSRSLAAEVAEDDARMREARLQAIDLLDDAELVHREALELELARARARKEETTELVERVTLSDATRVALAVERLRARVALVPIEDGTYVSGLVYDSAGKPLGGHQVALVEQGRVVQESRTDSRGAFLLVEKPSGAAGRTAGVVLEAAAAAPRTFTLRATAPDGRVVAEDSRPVSFGRGPASYRELLADSPGRDDGRVPPR